ncbi:MAG: hypothetical protein K8S27_00750 [Candidatus Omnitrophica bacterium]|nr:hypothetical protein [Candidatus Omnitrophota bacterium]
MTEHLQTLSFSITQKAKKQIQTWIGKIVIPDPILTIAWIADVTPAGDGSGHWAFLISANNPRKKNATVTIDGIDIYLPISQDEARMIQDKTIDSIDSHLTFI